jgi:hypothetical protein
LLRDIAATLPARRLADHTGDEAYRDAYNAYLGKLSDSSERSGNAGSES